MFTSAVGLARNAGQMILFRTLQGIAVSMCLATAVSLITELLTRTVLGSLGIPVA